MVNYILFIYLWPTIFTLLRTYYKPSNEISYKNKTKLVRHYISSINLILLLVFCPTYLATNKNIFYELSLGTSSSYLIWDLYYITLNNTKEYAYMFHHLAGLLLWELTLMSADFKIPIVILYALAELSNIPMFIIYYLLKTRDSTNKSNLKSLLYWKFIQVISYGPIRLLLIPYILCPYFFKMSQTLIVVISLMVIIMSYWQIHITRSYLKDRRDYNDLLKLE